MKKNIRSITEKFDDTIKALNEGNIELYESLKTEMDRMLEEEKNERKAINLEMKSVNFGVSNHIFQEQLPRLFKSDKKALKEYVNTVKDDRNLVAEALFYNAINSFDGSTDPKGYVKECIELASKKIDFGSVERSNKKVSKIMAKHKIFPDEKLNESDMRLYESCNYVLTHKKKLGNMQMISLMEERIADIISKKSAKKVNESKTNIYDIISNFESKYSKTMSESEIKVFKEIANDNCNVERKREIFEKYKKECIDLIEEMEKRGEDVESLNAIKGEIQNRNFNESSTARDIAKMIEIADVLKN